MSFFLLWNALSGISLNLNCKSCSFSHLLTFPEKAFSVPSPERLPAGKKKQNKFSGCEAECEDWKGDRVMHVRLS